MTEKVKVVQKAEDSDEDIPVAGITDKDFASADRHGADPNQLQAEGASPVKTDAISPDRKGVEKVAAPRKAQNPPDLENAAKQKTKAEYKLSGNQAGSKKQGEGAEEDEEEPKDCCGKFKKKLGEFFGSENRRCGLFVALIVVMVIIILVLSQLFYFARVTDTDDSITTLEVTIDPIEEDIPVCDDVLTYSDDILTSRDYTMRMPLPCFTDEDSIECRAELGAEQLEAFGLLT